MNEDTEITWLRKAISYSGEISDLGKEVARFLDRLWGLHHLPVNSLRKTNWSDPHYIAMVYDGRLATVDGDDLTSLVVLAHLMMLRVELRGCGPGYTQIVFHRRQSRDRAAGYSQWCPTIEDHVESIVSRYDFVSSGANMPLCRDDRGRDSDG